jgi:hypothetical protein
MSFNKLFAVFLLCLSFVTPSIASSVQRDSAKEIYELKRKITTMQTVDGENSSINEKYFKHKLAVSQVKMIKKVATYETHMFLARAGTKRSMSEISKMVDAAWDCSWIFVDLGNDHMERFERILEWCKGETNFKADTVSRWKKGQYIKSLNVTIKKDTEDWGPWQINADNFEYAQGIYRLYTSGVITFKIIRIRKLSDLFDIPTNCAVRCAIETDRKANGMEWQHKARPNDRAYHSHMVKKMKELQREGLYDPALVAKYYKLTPIKKYTHD